MALMRTETLNPVEKIQEGILLIHQQRVMLGADLAELYGIATKRLSEQVRRNCARFSEDFVLQLTTEDDQLFVGGFLVGVNCLL